MLIIKKYLPCIFFVCGIITGLFICRIFTAEADILGLSLNRVYTLNGMDIKLTDGIRLERASYDSPETDIYKIHMLPVRGYINGDKKDDAAIIIMTQISGQPPAYYAAAALGGMETGTNAVFIGAGITILEAEVEDGIIWVSILDRKPDENETNPPSIERLCQYIYRDGLLREIA